MSAPYTIDIPQFRIDFPQFADIIAYPDSVILNAFTQATYYVENTDFCYLTGDARYYALTLMTAHLLLLATWINQGQVPGLTTQAQIDKVNVSLMQPPVKSQWAWWLSLTGYGQSLLALARANSVGGMYIGGTPEGSAIRKVYGTFYT